MGILSLRDFKDPNYLTVLCPQDEQVDLLGKVK